ncbi:DNase I-like protein [Anaeromyces robustus]|uniref:DNase I-like protein n=1 Tax=Anaeromyces robustus TaxID=1754192 RepID=A0A1Y1X939_9FUNG|nr:DNase I-like protein [Anaeromyces robustus]ORX82273.1 DNase I-like protein [Anaeromyces robustus]|eukprot:ORX77676.1 DNase I-like protein [Anaeromyces robustus]
MTTTTENSVDSLKVLCGTWNVGAFQPKKKVEEGETLDLSGWIKVPDVDFIPEVVVLGFQELLKPTQGVQKPRTLVQMENSNKFIDITLYDNWIPHIQANLKKIFPNETYTIEVVHRYFGLGIIVFKRSHSNVETQVLHSATSPESSLDNHSSLSYEIKSISIGSVGTGALGFIGNKGAVAVGLELDIGLREPLKPCFIATHLHAFPGLNNFVERNEQVNYILDTLILSKIEKLESDKVVSVNNGKEDWKWIFSRQLSKDLYSKVQDYDFTFIMGDMNYRLLQKKGERHHSQVTNFVEQNKYDDLLVYDELRHIRSQKSFREVKKNPEENLNQPQDVISRDINIQQPVQNVNQTSELLFNEQFINNDFKKSWELVNTLMDNNPKKLYNPFLGFSESQIRFPPTYKYKTTSKAPFIDYDYKTYGKPVFSNKRIPAYTDRILFRVQHPKLDYDNIQYWQTYNKSVIKVKRYGTDRRLLLSDHKPVSASFVIDWKLLRKYNDKFPPVETSRGIILELPEDPEVNKKEGENETDPLISSSDNTDFTINPIYIASMKIQRWIKKCKTLIVNVIICTCLLCYLYLFQYN